jgi:hypothetical protein
MNRFLAALPSGDTAGDYLKILYLRERYHFGPGRIRAYLRRFHQIRIACSTVHRVLTRHGLNRLPADMKPRASERAWKR